MTQPTTAWALLERIAPHLGPYRERLVLVGGLAKRLYPRVPGFSTPVVPTDQTNDVDFALTDPLLVRGGTRLHEILVRAGLRKL